MIINDLDGYYIVFDTKNWNTELDTLLNNISYGRVVYKSIHGRSNKPAQELIGKLGGNAETETLSVSEKEVVPKMKLVLSFSDHYQK